MQQLRYWLAILSYGFFLLTALCYCGQAPTDELAQHPNPPTTPLSGTEPQIVYRGAEAP